VVLGYTNGYHGAVDPAPYLAIELYNGELMKTPFEPKVYIIVNDRRVWIKDENVFKHLFGYSVSKAVITTVDQITFSQYKYAGQITNTVLYK